MPSSPFAVKRLYICLDLGNRIGSPLKDNVFTSGGSLIQFLMCVIRFPKGDLMVDKALLFVQSKICEALTGSSYSAQCEHLNTPYTPQLTGK